MRCRRARVASRNSRPSRLKAREASPRRYTNRRRLKITWQSARPSIADCRGRCRAPRRKFCQILFGNAVHLAGVHKHGATAGWTSRERCVTSGRILPACPPTTCSCLVRTLLVLTVGVAAVTVADTRARQGPPTATQRTITAESSQDAQLLVGAWELVNFSRRSTDGRVTAPWGRQPAGRIRVRLRRTRHGASHA